MPATAPDDTSVTYAAPDTALAVMGETRRKTLALVGHLDDQELERAHSSLMSPLVWDLAHIAAYEDLWLAHRYGGLDLLRPGLAELYDAFETPRSKRGEIDLLGARDARSYLQEVRDRTIRVIAAQGVSDSVIYELVLRHELQHTETMRQTMAIADLLPPGEPTIVPIADVDGWIEISSGAFEMGAGSAGFAYDNERPRQIRETSSFHVARHPVRNATWLHFSEGGGYERREWWSDEGWAWKQEYDITHHPAVTTGHPDAPVCHVSWFEADAFARAHDARLPTETEWEKAATWEQETLHDVGAVWEWTSSTFGGYPGFVAHPYREYSEVFFGEDYRVLRGASWATDPRVATTTFRNWDYPQRRQIFAGLRLAKDA
jgi:iron(II)-dependent oxidoreductase